MIQQILRTDNGCVGAVIRGRGRIRDEVHQKLVMVSLSPLSHPVRNQVRGQLGGKVNDSIVFKKDAVSAS